jgi:hypothetical protein
LTAHRRLSHCGLEMALAATERPVVTEGVAKVCVTITGIVEYV